MWKLLPQAHGRASLAMLPWHRWQVEGDPLARPGSAVLEEGPSPHLSVSPGAGWWVPAGAHLTTCFCSAHCIPASSSSSKSMPSSPSSIAPPPPLAFHDPELTTGTPPRVINLLSSTSTSSSSSSRPSSSFSSSSMLSGRSDIEAMKTLMWSGGGSIPVHDLYPQVQTQHFLNDCLKWLPQDSQVRYRSPTESWA